jgi:hypothetical protein
MLGLPKVNGAAQAAPQESDIFKIQMTRQQKKRLMPIFSKIIIVNEVSPAKILIPEGQR